MPKNKFGPKAIANKMKAKGLQKLQFWCQMCQKQCRDANGFKCHLTSEAHERQMLLFAANSKSYMAKFSSEFEKGFLTLLSRRFGTRRVNANNAYNEYIQDKEHVHMNSTKWQTLTDFVQYLGKTGKCVVAETDRGFDIQWIDRSPAAEQRAAAIKKQARVSASEEQRELRTMRAKAERAQTAAASRGITFSESTGIAPRKGDESIDVEIKSTKPAPPFRKSVARPVPSLFAEGLQSAQPNRPKKRKRDELSDPAGLRKTSTRASFEVGRVQGGNSVSASPQMGKPGFVWCRESLIVKVMDKVLGDGTYYKRKGRVLEVESASGLVTVEMKNSGDVLQLPERSLQCVIPTIGRAVLVVRGDFAGQRAILAGINVRKGTATVRIDLTGVEAVVKLKFVCKFKLASE